LPGDVGKKHDVSAEGMGKFQAHMPTAKADDADLFLSRLSNGAKANTW